MGETGDEDESDDEGRPFSLFEVTEYAKLGQNLSLVNGSTNQNLQELAKIHELYKNLALPNSKLQIDGSQLQPSSLLEILANSRDSLIEEEKPEVDYESIASDFITRDVCNACHKTKQISAEQCHGLHDDYVNTIQSCCIEGNSIPQDNFCVCDIPPSALHQPGTSPEFPKWQEIENGSRYSLMKNRSETSVNMSDFNTLDLKEADNSLDTPLNDRVPMNGVSVPDFIEDVEANVVLCNPVQYSDYSLSKLDIEVPKGQVIDHTSDNDSDSLSNVSDDSDYVIRTSKFSKFLCVGVGRTKSKTPYKIAKANFKNESKKNSKMKESKVKVSSSKSRDSSKSPEFNSKNVLKSPSRAPSQNMSKSSSNTGSTNSSSGQSWPGEASLDGRGTRWNAKSHGNKGSTHNTSNYGTNASKGTTYNASNYGTSSSFSYQTTPVESYDSEHDSGLTADLPTPREPCDASWNLPMDSKTSKNVDSKRIPIQPSISTKSGTSSSIGTTPSLGESSGYGSMARDSECSSFSSSQDSEMDEEHKREKHRGRPHPNCKTQLPPVQLQKFTEEDIQRYESRSRTAECLQLQKEQRNLEDIAALKACQKQLKAELADAKKNLSVPDKSWSYERKSNVRISFALLRVA